MKDIDGYLAECEQGRQMGFDGKTLIHPGQVDGANTAFAPSEQAVEDARGLIAAFEDGSPAGNPASSPTTAGWSRRCTSSRPGAP